VTPTLQRLTARGRALAQRLKPQSASNRNVLKLAGDTAGSQVITVSAAPIRTRLYGPESFGLGVDQHHQQLSPCLLATSAKVTLVHLSLAP
jgi:hypothetical protein